MTDPAAASVPPSSPRTVWETLDVLVCVAAIIVFVHWAALPVREGAWMVVMIGVGRTGLAAVNKVLAIAAAAKAVVTALPASSSSTSTDAAAPAKPSTPPPQIPTAPLALLIALVAFGARALLGRFAPLPA